MKVTKTQVKDIRRNIKKEIVSWISIIVIAGCAVVSFLGVYLAGRAVRTNGDRYYTEHNQADITVSSTKLLTPEDVEKIKAVPGVEDVEECWKVGGVIRAGDDVEINVISLTDRISKTELVTGRYPENDEECVIQADIADDLNVKIGDRLAVADETNGVPMFLRKNVFKVTGIVDHPDNIMEKEDPTGAYIMVNKSVFGGDIAESGEVMQVLIKTEREDGETYFNKKHTKKVNEIKEQLENLGLYLSIPRDEAVKLIMDENYDELSKADEELAKAKKKIEDGKQELKDSKKRLEDGKAELEENRKLLDDAKKQLEDAKKELDAGKAELDSGKAELDSGKEKLDAGKAELYSSYLEIESAKNTIRNKLREPCDQAGIQLSWAGGNSNPDIDSSATTARMFYITTDYAVDVTQSYDQLINGLIATIPVEQAKMLAEFVLPGEDVSDDNVYEMLRSYASDRFSAYSGDYDKLSQAAIAWDNAHENDYLPALNLYNSKLAEYQTGLAKYQAGLNEYQEKLAEYEDGEKQYTLGLNDYRHGLKLYSQGEKDLEKGEAEYKENESKYQDAMLSYFQAQETMKDIGDCKWVVTSQRSNIDYMLIDVNGDSLLSISVTFSMFFVILAGVVIYATVGKIISEQKKLVGSTKAFGFTNSEISIKYKVYALTASYLGGVAGVIIGVIFLQEFALERTYLGFRIGELRLLPGFFEIILTFFALTFLSLLAVRIATRKMLKEPATELLRGEMPKGLNGESNKKHKSLFAALIFRNMRVDKKRVVVMLCSVLGCSLLLMVGFDLKYAITDALDRQFDEVICYDEILTVSMYCTDPEAEEVEQILTEEGAEFARVHVVTQTFLEDGEFNVSKMIVGEPEELQKFYKLENAFGTGEITLSDNGIYVTKITAEKHGFTADEPGSLRLFDSYANPYDVEVAGVYVDYIDNFFMMSSDEYKSTFGYLPAFESYLIKLNGADHDTLHERLHGLNVYRRLKDFEAEKAYYSGWLQTVNYVILILVFVAILMSYFILNNLINMYLNQKKKELSVMRINGFTLGEVNRYMMLELVIITIVGIILGNVAGIFVGRFLVGLLETSTAMLVRTPNIIAIGLGSLITAIFSMIIILMVGRKIKNLDIKDAAQ